ncbi:hypothetical protein V3C52_18055 [Escherichia coli]
MKTYTGFWGNGATTKVVFRIDVLTPEGVYYGEYAQDGYTLWLGNIPNTVWTGPGSAPTMNITHQSNTVDNSIAQGLRMDGHVLIWGSISSCMVKLTGARGWSVPTR